MADAWGISHSDLYLDPQSIRDRAPHPLRIYAVLVALAVEAVLCQFQLRYRVQSAWATCVWWMLSIAAVVWWLHIYGLFFGSGVLASSMCLRVSKVVGRNLIFPPLNTVFLYTSRLRRSPWCEFYWLVPNRIVTLLHLVIDAYVTILCIRCRGNCLEAGPQILILVAIMPFVLLTLFCQLQMALVDMQFVNWFQRQGSVKEFVWVSTMALTSAIFLGTYYNNLLEAGKSRGEQNTMEAIVKPANESPFCTIDVVEEGLNPPTFSIPTAIIVFWSRQSRGATVQRQPEMELSIRNQLADSTVEEDASSPDDISPPSLSSDEEREPETK